MKGLTKKKRVSEKENEEKPTDDVCVCEEKS